MPAPEVAYLLQSAVLWANEGTDAYGQPLVGDPVEIKVRWLFGKRESTDAKGNTVTTDVTVIAKQTIAIGSIMWLGTLEDIPGTSLVPTSDLYEVISYKETPDLKNRVSRRELMLMRYNDTLPVS